MKRLSFPPTVLAVMLLSALLAGCATGSADGPRTSRDMISEEEIRDLTVASAYQAVQRLRPRWLQGRGATSLQNPGASLPTVFLDEVRYGSIQSLENIQLTDVRAIRFINAMDATTRFGTGYPSGVIEVITKW